MGTPWTCGDNICGSWFRWLSYESRLAVNIPSLWTLIQTSQFFDNEQTLRCGPVRTGPGAPRKAPLQDHSRINLLSVWTVASIRIVYIRNTASGAAFPVGDSGHGHDVARLHFNLAENLPDHVTDPDPATGGTS